MSKTVLITGAAGLIGSHLHVTLAKKYDIRLMDLKPIPGLESVVADITDMNALLAAFKGVDSIIHLAGSSTVDSSWNDVLRNNIIGTYTVFEAACQANVSQIIYASSNHAVGTYEMEQAPGIYRLDHAALDHLIPVRPDSLYGVSKCFGEALGRFFADHRGLRIICLRIGSINCENSPNGATVAEMNKWLPTRELRYERVSTTWQSQRDFAQLVEKCLEATHVKFDIFYGVSNNPHRFLDLEHARTILGYDPQDSSAKEVGEKQV
jgi:nucleoside-diphosphate-sugar epimerase